MSINGFRDREGVRSYSPVMGITTAMMASNGIMAALLPREHTGQGQLVQVSLIHDALLMNGYASRVLQHWTQSRCRLRNY